ncbi:hypothetical protein [Paenibacillus wulumuqiensis]|uniref:hypothetical protein n=1 Tax=Paenibacillus wulumuqiensis TaxID=1567107 RepID=UPI000619EF79|nr:hypothetical protein [Paenibacillus wulumuqiensis]
MKKYSTWILAAGTIMVGIWAGSSFTTVSNASSQLGSADDPVVTKSYVDQQIQKALGGTISSTDSKTNSSSSKDTLPSSSASTNTSGSSSNKNNTSSTTTTPPVSGSTSTPATQTGSSSSASNGVSIVELRPGKKLIAEPGTQLIVRTGKAKVYSEGTNGLIDITVGKELGGSQAAPNNHLLLFPREGRGVEVDSTLRYNATIMVIGNYKVL